MNFNEIIVNLKNSIGELENDYDGLIVKKLEASNTLDEDRTTHQTHIAISGSQMDLFPCLMANQYFNCNYEQRNDQLKKYFVLRLPVRIFKGNITKLLGNGNLESFHFGDSNNEMVSVCAIRSRRNNQVDQLQLSLLSYDDNDFVSFRRLLTVGDYLVILKVKNKLEYECIGIKSSWEEAQFVNDLNNKLMLMDASITPVDGGRILIEKYDNELGLQELSQILSDMYNNADENYKVASIYMFGIKYSKLILEKQYRIRDIISNANINQSYEAELSKALNIYRCLIDNRYGIKIELDEIEITGDEDRITGGYNMIYYGIPGCGKSHLVNQTYSDLDDGLDNIPKYEVIRTTFHPDYSNSDFIGQIIPKLDNNHNVYYDFQEGPFTVALLTALKNSKMKVCLIIEEINRGNASAVFGDIFQLLDRDNDGNSVYGINNNIIKKYLKDHGVKIKGKIRIPSNLWIIGTMNTCDQNVYALDTAFKRRWKMHRIVNKFDENNELANMYIPGSNYTWREFVETINTAILEKNPGGLNGEDKQIGVYFVTKNELTVNKTDDCEKESEYFAEKVLIYIWEDIAKIDPTLWFSSSVKSFDELLGEFKRKHLDIFKDLFDEAKKADEDEEILDEQ